MGGSSKKTTSSSTQTSTPNNPQWVTDSLKGLNSRITSLGNVDPESYVAGPSALQTQSYDAGSKLGSNSGLFDTASQGAIDAGNTSVVGNIDRYMNPYQKNVIDASNAYADQNDAEQMGRLKAQAAGSGAFGDSTYGIAQGQTLGQQALARQATNAGLLQSGYTQAAGLANQDIQNKLSSSGLLGNLATASGADARANASTMNALGQDQRSIAQDKATAPISLAEALAGLYGKNQMGLFQGQTTTGNSTTKTTSDPGLLGGLGGILGAIPGAVSGISSLAPVAGAAAKGLAGLFSASSASDVRLKTDIRPLGKDAEGRNRYAWRYVWGEPGEGYMAHEVAQTDPEAVSESGGYLMVDHSKMRGQPQWRV
jgi:hypothetical protein